jgi:hypothetical protein
MSIIDKKNQVNQPAQLLAPLTAIAADRLAVTRAGFEKSLAMHDYSALSKFAGWLSAHIDCKYALTREERASFAMLLQRGLVESRRHGALVPNFDSRALHTLVRLLKKPTKLEENFQPLEGVTIDWRILADIVLQNVHSENAEGFDSLSGHANTVYR